MGQLPPGTSGCVTHRNAAVEIISSCESKQDPMNIHLQRRFDDTARISLAALLVSCSFAIATFESANAAVPHVLLHSLPDPGTNAQAGALQGFSVAVDGNIAVAGAPGVAVVDDKQAENSGVVKV